MTERIAPISVVLAALAFGIAAAGAARQAPPDPLPPGDGRAAVVTMCGASTCHGVRSSVEKRRTRLDWQSLIDDMREKGAPGTDDDAHAALGYLLQFFGVVDVNKAPADEIRQVLGLSADESSAIVAYRTAHGPFGSLDDLKKVSGLDADALDKKKDAVLFSNR